MENDRNAVRVIQENLRFTKLSGDADVLQMDAADVSLRLSGRAVFDVIFMDPPYDQGLEQSVMHAFRNSACVHEDTLFVIEASLDTPFDWLETEGYTLVKEKRYKTNKHIFAKPIKGADII